MRRPNHIPIWPNHSIFRHYQTKFPRTYCITEWMSWLGFDGRSQPGNQITGAINSNARMESELGLVSPEKGLQIQYYELLQMPPNIHFSLLNTLIDFFLSYISMFFFFFRWTHLRQHFPCWGFAGGWVVKIPLAKAGDLGLISGPGRSHMPWSS